MDIVETCKKLDSLCIEELEMMEEYVRCKTELEKLMKSGFLNIAKARYVMGKTSVSSLQLPSEDASDIAALHRVSLNSEDGVDDQKFELVSESKEVSETKNDTNQSIRKRVVSEENNPTEEKTNTKFNLSDSNPLKWFGVLVPQNLRQAQADFTSALPLVVECANIQMKLITSSNRYQEALRKKCNITIHN